MGRAGAIGTAEADQTRWRFWPEPTLPKWPLRLLDTR